MSSILIPPIKCQGIKSKLVPWIVTNAVKYNGRRWLEPFMGSGVVGFNAAPKCAVFNDKNPHIIEFYTALSKRKILPEKVRSFLVKEGELLKTKGEEHYYFIRDRFNKLKNPLDFLFLSRSCFNGIMRFNSKGGFNVPFCRKPNRFSKSYITKIVNQIDKVYNLFCLNKWEFTHLDFREIFKEVSKHDFVYCDPPYFGRHVDYYNSWSEKDEEDLYLCLKRTKAKFALSTWYENKFRKNISIEKYWRHFNIEKKDHFYHIGGREANRNQMIEALVMNFSPSSKLNMLIQK